MAAPALEDRVNPVPPENRTSAEIRGYTRRMLKRCQQLKVGDFVRFVQMPSEADWPGVYFPPETCRLYRRLVARRHPSRIVEIDEWGMPLIMYQFRDSRGRWEYHALIINDDSWVRVRRRGGTAEVKQTRKSASR